MMLNSGAKNLLLTILLGTSPLFMPQKVIRCY